MRRKRSGIASDTPMGIVVSLQDVVEAMDLPNEEWTSYLNPNTGEIVTVTDEERRLVEEGKLDDPELPEWQRELLPKGHKALDSEDYIPLPNKFEIHEWSVMERFSSDRANPGQREELLDAIHGSGAFRKFRDAIRRLGVEEDWYRFRQSALEQIAIDWLEAHGIAYR